MRPVLLITGASTGIGAACARLAAQQGYDLVLNYRRNHDAAEEVAQAAQDAGARSLLCPADMADPDAITDMFSQIDAEFGQLDALINNAGVIDQPSPVTGMSFGRLRRMFDTNVIGPMLVASEAVQRMLAQGDGGAIVNMSSAAARLGSANQYVDYAASKAALDTFTKGLSDEVAAAGIRVMSLRPGLIETDIHAKGGIPDRTERLANTVPMQRAGSAEEVARAALWLLSDDASYITGSTLDVTGGR